ncbi:ABC transporter ATP-binding protein [Motilimonas eburnea]|uniref:ABC transporter ATP-binding protein n=1 Tax=Motilimonas eburnea TaxID=1737488 RepID=UPI001E41F339|nr:ABC transporter ATP-binding protein [Motilimonas eburnea]MCE2572481.1 ABC transporter ATP-binding protein [Motilimonas eburnea]
MSQLVLSHVSKSYLSKQRPDTLLDVNLYVNQGECLGVVGPSGSGKSTLLRIIAGLETVTKGEVRFNQQVMTDTAATKRNLEMVFQKQALLPHMSVADNILFGLKNKGLKRADQRLRLKWVSQLFDIDGWLTRLPGQLSKEAVQRCAIAKAMAPQSELVLFDEPFTGLSGDARSQLRLELNRIQRQLGTTFVMVTHQYQDAMAIADKMAVLSHLRANAQTNLEQVGPPLELYHNPRNSHVAKIIGEPQMCLLKGTLVDLSHNLTTIELATGGTVRAQVDTRQGEVGNLVTLGIRAEHMQLANADKLVHVTAQVVGIDNFGCESVVHLMRQDQKMVMRLAATSHLPKVSDVGLHFPSEHCYLFNHQDIAFPRTSASLIY